MLNIEELISIIDDYKKSIIQSEAEVRSKLIVPILDWLGYPSEFRAEEFPIYAYEGGRALPAKNADFVLFNDNQFGNHRSKTERDIEWVHDHSLLVFEAKKPEKQPEVYGQPMFYTVWSRSVAYIITDGILIKGYIYNWSGKDHCVFSCKVVDIANEEGLSLFSYDSIQELKAKHDELFSSEITMLKEKATAQLSDAPIQLVSDEAIQLPEDVLNYMRAALGRNAIGLGRLGLVERFLKTTDSFLQNGIRYDVPEYMADIPRCFFKGSLHLNSGVFPFVSGDIIQYYRNEYERIQFHTDSLDVSFMLNSEQPVGVRIWYHVHNESVTSRLHELSVIKTILEAKQLGFSYECDDGRIRRLDIDLEKVAIMTRVQDELSMVGFWIEGLSKMKVIEDYYELRFVLKPVPPEKTFSIYQAVDYVFRGISRQPNCHRIIEGFDLEEDLVVEEPILVEQGKINIKCLRIHNYTFVPQRIYLPTGTIPAAKSPYDVDFCAVLEPEEKKTKD